MRYTVEQAAQAVRKSARTVRRWIADGHVKAVAEPGKLGARYTFTRDQLDALRTFAARDVELALPVVELDSATQPGVNLAPQPFDLGGLVDAVAAAVDAERQASARSAERQAAAHAAALAAVSDAHAQQLAAERQAHAATVAALRSQIDAERRRADDAGDALAHARALLGDALELVAGARAQQAARATQPVDRRALVALDGGGAAR